MTWVMEILNIHLEEQPLTKYYMIKCLVLPKCDYYQRWLAPMGYTFFSENFGCAIKSQTVSNQQFAKNLPKPENEKYTNLL